MRFTIDEGETGTQLEHGGQTYRLALTAGVPAWIPVPKVRPLVANEPVKTDDFYWLQTYTGRKFNLAEGYDVYGNEVHVPDVARSTARICRFNGHVAKVDHYSVAEHEVLITQRVIDLVEMNGCIRYRGERIVPTIRDLRTLLCHDAAESVLGDVTWPLKQMLPDYKKIEAYISKRFAYALNVDYPVKPWMKDLDHRALADEKPQVMADNINGWVTDGLEPLGFKVMGWPAWQAEHQWLKLYDTLR